MTTRDGSVSAKDYISSRYHGLVMFLTVGQSDELILAVKVYDRLLNESASEKEVSLAFLLLMGKPSAKFRVSYQFFSPFEAGPYYLDLTSVKMRQAIRIQGRCEGYEI